MLARLLEAGADPACPDGRGFTPLILASYNGHADAVALLLARGAAVDGADAHGSTALGGVAFKGLVGIARQLLAAGAEVDKPDAAGRTPLIFATMFGRAEHGRAAAAARRRPAAPRRRGRQRGGRWPGKAATPAARRTRPAMLTPALAARFAATALGHVTREYPNKPGNVLAGPADARTPQRLHPVFHGSFDWHSCVHGYWMLARLLRLFPAMAPASEIRHAVRAAADPGEGGRRVRHLPHPMAAGFERPYGWAWLLKLDVALADLPDRKLAGCAGAAGGADRGAARGVPADRRPTRCGSARISTPPSRWRWRPSTAAGDARLLAAGRTAEGWYGADADCQAWEPGGDDFLSPALIEAECMRRLLPPARFLTWFDGFLPHLAEARPLTLFAPVSVSDRSDGKIAHLDGAEPQPRLVLALAGNGAAAGRRRAGSSWSRRPSCIWRPGCRT